MTSFPSGPEMKLGSLGGWGTVRALLLIWPLPAHLRRLLSWQTDRLGGLLTWLPHGSSQGSLLGPARGPPRQAGQAVLSPTATAWLIFLLPPLCTRCPHSPWLPGAPGENLSPHSSRSEVSPWLPRIRSLVTRRGFFFFFPVCYIVRVGDAEPDAWYRPGPTPQEG